jgi:Kef-type K+ transport system membrane component KefB
MSEFFQNQNQPTYSKENIQMGHSAETGFLVVCLIALFLPPFIHTFVRKYVPLVVVQIAVGIAIGPTILMHVWPDAYAFIADPKVLTTVKGIGFLAVLPFAFQIGTHLDLHQLCKETKGGTAVKASQLWAVSLTSLVVPLVVAFPVGLYFGSFTELLGPNGSSIAFASVYAMALAVTALPVLAKILNEMGYTTTTEGRIALVCAVFNDGALWVLLALFMGLVTAQSEGMSGLYTLLAWTGLYGVVMLYVVRPFLQRLKPSNEESGLTVPIVLCLASALATHLIGLHALLGAVVAGAIVPEHLKKTIERHLGKYNEYILLPLFFISTGLQTDIPLQWDPLFWSLAIVSTVVTVVTKVYPTAYVAKKVGLLECPQCFKLGAFMAPKGLMEIVFLTIVRDMGMISQATFGALVVMAILTTAKTMPLVLFFRRNMPHRSTDVQLDTR